MKRVYLVDDDVDQVENMTMILEAKGYAVGSQFDDADLVDNIREFNADVIILDVMFPGDDSAGFRMARLLRQEDRFKTKPIIMLSAVNEEGSFPGKFSNKDIDDAFLPITVFIDKPVDPNLLTAKIEALT
ncbi:MAG: response regulator transcription factor [Verrucomicrobia bacterium]|jgi:DNA-binding response OmpR family regulator|nr:response regulator transcription factor [Verrucomicrobiota bacterium]